MKRVVLSLIGSSCFLVAAAAFGQTSVLVAQKDSDVQKANAPFTGTCDKVCRDWPVYFEGDNALFLCDEWPDFGPGQAGAEDCNDDPDATYAYFSADASYPCDCSASSGDFVCPCSRNDGERDEKPTEKRLAAQKFGGLAEGQHQPDTDLTLLVTEKDVTTSSGCIFKCTAQVLPMTPKYNYINANVPKKVGGPPDTTLKAIVYLVELHRTNCSGKPIKKFWLAYECTKFPATATPSTVNLDIARHDQGTNAPYYAFTGRFNGKPILLLTSTAVQP